MDGVIPGDGVPARSGEHHQRAQRLAVALSLAKGLDPDRPRNLERSVVLEQSHV